MNNNNLFEHYNYNTIYDCSPFTKCKYFNKLMYLIINKTDFHVISNYLINNLNEINQVNEYGWTALMIASRNSNTINNLKTVKLLLENGADINRQDNNRLYGINDGCTIFKYD